MYVVAVVKDNITKKKGKGKKTDNTHDINNTAKSVAVGVNVFSTESMETKFIDSEKFIKGLKAGIKVANISFENDNLKFIDYNINRIPVLHRNDYTAGSSTLRTLIPLNGDTYLLVSMQGDYIVCNSDTAKDYINKGYVINPSYFNVTSKEIRERQAIIDYYTSRGFTDIQVSSTCKIHSMTAPDNADLVLFLDSVTYDYHSIKSVSNVFNSITICRNKSRALEEAEGVWLTSILHGGYNITVSNLIVQDCKDLYNCCLFINNLNNLRKQVKLVIDFDLNKEIKEKLRTILGAHTGSLYKIIKENKVQLEIKPENAFADTEENYKIISEYIYNIFNLYLYVSTSEARELAAKVSVDGSWSPNQCKALDCLDTLRNMFSEGLYKKLVGYVHNRTISMEKIIEMYGEQKYDKYNAVCIRRSDVNFIFNRPRRKDQSFYPSEVITYIDTIDFEKKIDQYRYVREDYSVRHLDYDINKEYFLLGVNKKYTDDIVYCLIKVKANNRGAKIFDKIVNKSVIEVITLLEKSESVYAGLVIRHGNYIILQSASDLMIYDAKLIDNEIESVKSQQLKRLESVNDLMGVKSNFVITALGLLTKIKEYNADLKIPSAVKELGTRVFTESYYRTIELPEGISPIKRTHFEYCDARVDKLIVHDAKNAIAGLDFMQYRYKARYGSVYIGKIHYPIKSQQELYQFLAKAWLKESFHAFYVNLYVGMRLDKEHTEKLFRYLKEKSGFNNYVEALETYGRAVAFNVNKQYAKQLKLFKRCFSTLNGFVDEGVLEEHFKSVSRYLF